MDEIIDLSSKCPHAQTCPVVSTQTATVCLPVTVTPYAKPGTIEIVCCGGPVIDRFCDRCFGKINGSCKFTITQTIKVKIPVEFGANVSIGDTYVKCDCFRGENSDDEELKCVEENEE